MGAILAIKAVAFGSAAVAIHALGLHRLAIGFAAVAFLNTAVATVDRDAAMRVRPE
jgi:hypothetical protein